MQVFPVRKSFDTEKQKWSKHPAVPKGQDWREYQATPEELSHAANIGICIPDGTVVIDLDTQKGVTREAVEDVLGCSLDWEGAILQITVSGGEHYAFALPDGATVRQGDSILGVPGFDTRCAGKGWICSGDGYKDQTLIGLPHALYEWQWPPLPEVAVEKLQTTSVARDDDDLMSMVLDRPLDDISLEEIKAYLGRLPAGDLDQYDTWLKVGMACHHQTTGKKEGFRVWHDWSKGSKHYDRQELKAKWLSFGRHTGDKIKFSYVIHRAGGRVALASSLMDSFEERIARANGREDYVTLRDEIRSIDRSKLPDDMRSMLGKMLAEVLGKDIGLSASEIKKALVPTKKIRLTGGETDKPDWVLPWVYVETACEFANVDLNYSIKREAFNAKYDRLPQVVIAEKSASAIALNDYQIPTVVDRMFWPGADMIFEHEGKPMLNSYRISGAEAADEIDEDGMSVVNMIMDHVRFTLSDKNEQRILLDWIAYVVQNPGKRINWALLLQGAQGVGKSYFVYMLQHILGSNVSNLDPTAIAGRFTGWAHGSLVVAVEEIRISGTNKYEVLDRLKPFITNDTIQIEEKGRDHRTVPNFTSYLMLTNHKDAIPLTEGDRRYCVLFSRVQTEAQLYSELGGPEGVEAYFSRLFDETARRADAVKTFFMDWLISRSFSARGRAPKTLAREQMVAAAVSPDRSMIEDAIDYHRCEVINESVLDVTWLNELMQADGNELPKTRTLSAVLFEMGYEQIPGRRMKVSKTGNYHYVWVSGKNEYKETMKNFFGDKTT